MKDLEYIVNGIIVEDESKAEQDEAQLRGGFQKWR